MNWIDTPSYARLPNPVFEIELREAKIPVVLLPEELLSKRLQGLKINVYVLLGFMAAPGNIKRIPAEYMLNAALTTGLLKEGGELVEPTSGNMGVSLAHCAKRFNVSVTAIVSNDLPHGKRVPIERQGATVLTEEKASALLGLARSSSSIKLAGIYAQERGAVFLNQYSNPWNPESYDRLVAPLVWAQLDGQLSMFVSATGSKGTALGLGRYFKAENPKIEIISTMPYLGQKIDGTRDMERQREATHDLASLGAIEEPIDEITARAYSALLNQAGIPGGPSSGAAFGSLQHRLLVRLGNNTLDELRGPDGTIGAFTTFADTLYPYG